MSRSASDTVQAYLAGQAVSVQEALRFIADDAVFDVGRGRYEGLSEVAEFVERLRAVHSRTSVLELHDVSPTDAVAVFEQHDDDLIPLGIDSIRLNVHVETTEDGRIKTFRARPTQESIERLAAARDAGRSSVGLRLAERAGTVPSDT